MGYIIVFIVCENIFHSLCCAIHDILSGFGWEIGCISFLHYDLPYWMYVSFSLSGFILLGVGGALCETFHLAMLYESIHRDPSSIIMHYFLLCYESFEVVVCSVSFSFIIVYCGLMESLCKCILGRTAMRQVL